MNIQNLALIFTPVIFHDFNQTDENNSGDWSPEDLFEDLILHYELLFPIAEENARKNNEHKLALALSGKSPYSQFSQSNLLYLSKTALQTPTPAMTNNMLLTQPMNPSLLMSNNSGPESPGGPMSLEQQYSNQYPPNLPSIINAVPHQRLGSLQQQQQPYIAAMSRAVNSPGNMNDSSTRIIPPRYQSESINNQYQQQLGISRSTSETTVMQRGSSMSTVPLNENLNNGGSGNYSGPISTSNSNSPVPTKGVYDSVGTPIPPLTKRDSSSLLQQQQGLNKPGAPPRHDSLRKSNSRLQNPEEKALIPDDHEKAEEAQSFASITKQTPPQITTTNLSDKEQTQQQPQYYHSGLHQEYVLPSGTDGDFNALLDCYSPVNSDPPSLESKPSPK